MRISKRWNGVILRHNAWWVGALLPLAGMLLSAMQNRLIAGFAVSAGLWFLIFDFIYLALKTMGMLPIFGRMSKKSLLVLVGVIAAANIILFMVVGRNQTIYYWDHSGNWIRVLYSTQMWFENLPESLSHLYRSIQQDEYNYTVSYLLAAPMKLVPAAFVLAVAAAKMRAAFVGEGTGGWFALFFGAVLLFPVALRPVANGYMNAWGFLWLAAVYLLVMDNYFFAFSVKKSLLLAGSLLLVMVGQRAFAYAVIGFAAGCLAIVVYRWLAKELTKQKLLGFVGNMALAGGLSLGVLLVFFRQLLLRGLLNDFSAAYSAYQFGTLLGNFGLMFKTFGVIPTALCLLGVVLGFTKRNTRMQTVFLLTSLLVEAALFFQVQSLDTHHYYIVLPSLLLLCLQGVFMAAEMVGTRWVPVICGAALLFNTAQNCILPVLNLPRLPGFSQSAIAPTVRNDLPVIAALVGDLNTHFSDKPVYVAASGFTLNDDILRNSQLPDTLNAVPQVLGTYHIDLRDGFPTSFFEAGAVVVTEPTEAYLWEGQLVTRTIAELILDGTFDDHFYHVGSYPLDNGVVALVYARSSPLDVEDRQLLADIFDGYYPEYPEFFSQRISAE